MCLHYLGKLIICIIIVTKAPLGFVVCIKLSPNTGPACIVEIVSRVVDNLFLFDEENSDKIGWTPHEPGLQKILN